MVVELSSVVGAVRSSKRFRKTDITLMYSSFSADDANFKRLVVRFWMFSRRDG